MKIYLAPMEGLADYNMRRMLTGLGGYDYCVTEFIRVVDHLLPRKVFKNRCAELLSGGQTHTGTPVIVQLLGSNKEMMAANAIRAVELGARGIDLNFGCPSRCVTKSNGGAILLKEPDRIHDIIYTVRQAVDDDIPVSAKIRLGFSNTDLTLDIAHAVQSAGADFIVVHARTKVDGYKPPARWEWIAKIREELTIPVVANGDITSVAEYRRCIATTGVSDVMIGRAAVSCPDLALQIVSDIRGLQYTPLEWSGIQVLISQLIELMQAGMKERYWLARIKQWLSLLRKSYPEANICFDLVKTFKKFDELERYLGRG